MAGFFEYHASNALKFSLGDFEGPIDLLYNLIVIEGKYEIDDFPISTITGQYMEYMQQIDSIVDMDMAADFISVASTLLEIKSRSVLPKEAPAEFEDVDEWEPDPEELLKFRLRVYAMFKEQAGQLKQLETTNRMYRSPDYTDDDAKIVIKNFNLDNLIDAYGRILFRMSDEDKKNATKKIARDTYTVAEKIAFITEVLREKKEVLFSELFVNDFNKSEVIATFSALLELMKKQVAKAKQESMAEDIYITIDENCDIEHLNIEELVKTEDDYNG